MPHMRDGLQRVAWEGSKHVRMSKDHSPNVDVPGRWPLQTRERHLIKALSRDTLHL